MALGPSACLSQVAMASGRAALSTPHLWNRVFFPGPKRGLFLDQPMPHSTSAARVRMHGPLPLHIVFSSRIPSLATGAEREYVTSSTSCFLPRTAGRITVSLHLLDCITGGHGALSNSRLRGPFPRSTRLALSVNSLHSQSSSSLPVRVDARRFSRSSLTMGWWRPESASIRSHKSPKGCNCPATFFQREAILDRYPPSRTVQRRRGGFVCG
ncbi:hypothetical protein C8R46DRAFT_1354429 [Mycena filopes]|nr:hypothetical protein C8R46DRAFT_1354429 [Mycena filopes]